VTRTSNLKLSTAISELTLAITPCSFLRVRMYATILQTEKLGECEVAPLRCCVTPLLRHAAAASRRRRITTPLHRDAAASRRRCTTTPLRHATAASRRRPITTPLLYDVAG
jgi:hypothetical protein